MSTSPAARRRTRTYSSVPAFLGCPGVGKSTYTSRLSNLLGVPHIVIGDLVRDELRSSDSKLKEIVNQGKLVFSEIIKKIGANTVDVDLKQQKVTVTGYVEPKKVLQATKSTKKKVEMWPYVPYTIVAHPCVSQDKKAPANHVRAIPPVATIEETTVDDAYSLMFNDENPNACSIM